jgi:hypothetical protein
LLPSFEDTIDPHFTSLSEQLGRRRAIETFEEGAMRANAALFFVATFFALSAELYAQEAITGRVVDPTGSVLPGVGVKAVHDTTGNG